MICDKGITYTYTRENIRVELSANGGLPMQIFMSSVQFIWFDGL